MVDALKYKKRLEEELVLVEGELKGVGRKSPSNPLDWEAKPTELDITVGDPNEVADKIESYEENTGILKNLEIRWNNIKNALTKIERGTYGICEIGGEKIEDERLDANSAARTCIKHLGREEQ